MFSGMKVHIQPIGQARPGGVAHVVDVVRPGNMQTLENVSSDSVTAAMLEMGIKSGIFVEFVGRPHVFIFEELNDGRFRQLDTEEYYTFEEAEPHEMQMEIQ